jgi:AcrR family transcriptional regulator
VTSQAPRTYGGASAQERRDRRRAALLDATLDVVAAKGVNGLGVKAICTAAGLNDRYFYEQFKDCDEALMALNDHLILEGTAAFMRTIAATEPEAHTRLRACVATAFDFVTVDPRRGRFLIESQSTEQLRAKRHHLVTTLADLMMSGRQLLGVDAPSEQDSRLMALTITSGGLDVAAMWLRGDLDIDREKLIDFMTAFVLSSTRMSALPI